MIIFAIKTDSNTVGQDMAKIIHVNTAVFERLPIGTSFFDLYMVDSVSKDAARRIEEEFEDERRIRDHNRRDYRRDDRDRDRRDDFFCRGYGPTTLNDFQTLATHVANVTEAETVLIITDKFNVATGDAEYVSALFEASMDFYVDQFRNRGVVRTESVKLSKPMADKIPSPSGLNINIQK